MSPFSLPSALTRTLPDGEEESFTYNIYSQVATHTDFDGNTAVYTYYGGSGANAGALQEVVYGGAIGSGKATETVTYTYTSLGQQATVTDASGTTTDSYDAEGDLVDQDTPEGDIQHTYSPVTGELTETKTDNTDVTYAYNDLGELITTTVNELNGQTLATPLMTTDAYDLAGNKTRETLPNGVVTSWTDDDLNRLISMSEMLNDTTLFSQTFTLHDDGTRASSDQTQLQPDGSTITTDTTWSNNALGELTSETLSSSDSSQDYTDIFKYDLVGNRLTSAHTGPGNGADENITNTYNGDDELTKEVSTLSGETDLRYDPNGSLTTSTNGSDVTTYGYDVRNKMTSANVNGVTTSYVYDDAGNRVGETTAGVTTFYLTDDDNPTGYAQPIEQKASAAAVPTVTYVIGDRVLAQADATGAVSYLLTDGHGSTRALTNSAGAVTQTFNYTAFGRAIGFTPSASTPIYLFGGDAVFDYASGLYLNGDGTRGRVPGAGSFMEADPRGFSNSQDPITLHKYLYANANAVMNVDASGHDVDVISTLGAIGITSGVAGLVSGTVGGLAGLVNGQGFAQGFGSGAVSGFISTAVPLALEVFTGGFVPPFLAFGLGGALGELASQAIFGSVTSAKGITSIIISGVTGGIAGKLFGAGSVESVQSLANLLEPGINSVLEKYSAEIALNGIGGALKNSANQLFQDVFFNGGEKTAGAIARAVGGFFSSGAASETGSSSAFIGAVGTSVVATSGSLIIDLVTATVGLIKKVAGTSNLAP